MGNVMMEASQINYRGGETKMSVEDALKSTSGEAAAIAQLQTDVGNLQTTKANQITIAPFFSAETAYDPGDLVYYNGLTYRCVNAHEGEWDADDFAATTISTELDTLKSGLTKVTLLSPTLATSTETTYEMTDSISKYMMIVACIGFDQYRFQGSITMPIVNTMQYYDVANGDGSKTIGFAFVDATHVKMSGDWYLSIYGIMPIYG